MPQQNRDSLISELVDGRTDLVFELVTGGLAPTAVDQHGVSLVQWCAYYGDVSALKFLLSQGASLDSLGRNLGLAAASFHGHWRLTQFLLEQGAEVNEQDAESGEAALHNALCTNDRLVYDRVLKVLLLHGANPNVVTKPDAVTGGFMRDCRTKGETPLHRAAAFGDDATIKRLLDAGANKEARDAHGDTPLSWASWYNRPDSILRSLCYGNYRINPNHQSMRANLLGMPHGADS